MVFTIATVNYIVIFTFATISIGQFFTFCQNEIRQFTPKKDNTGRALRCYIGRNQNFDLTEQIKTLLKGRN